MSRQPVSYRASRIKPAGILRWSWSAPWFLGLMIAMGWIATVAPASALQEEGEKKVEIRVHNGEGHRAIFIDDEGNVERVDGEEAEVWIQKMRGSGGDHETIVFGEPHAHSGAFLGVQLTELTDDLRAHFGVPEGQGVMVGKIIEGSPAQESGLQVGDIVVAVDGDTIAGAGSLSRAIAQREVGSGVALQVYREGRVESLSATLSESERPKRMALRSAGSGSHKSHKTFKKRVMVDCEKDGQDCDDLKVLHLKSGHLDLDVDCESENCEIQVQCEEPGGCECSVNGEPKDCKALGVSG